jgi:hypothetical protein
VKSAIVYTEKSKHYKGSSQRRARSTRDQAKGNSIEAVQMLYSPKACTTISRGIHKGKKGMKHEEEQICPAQSISHHAATQKRYSSSCYGVCR